MNQNHIHVLVVEPEKQPYAKEIPSSLESLQHEVGGYIEAVYPFTEPVALICNDESKLNGSPLNRALRDDEGHIYDIMAGTFLVVGLGDDNFTSLSPELMQKFTERFKNPELFAKINGKLVVTAMPEIQDVSTCQNKPSYFPLYPHTAAYARAHNELEAYRISNRANYQCKEAIEGAIREHFDGMHLNGDAASGVIQAYGMERVMHVLANTVQFQDWDGRYSRRNKEWAKTIPNHNSDTVRCGYILNSHPVVINGMIDIVREEAQRHQTMGRKEPPARPSVRDKLRQNVPDHKPAAPKKREPER